MATTAPPTAEVGLSAPLRSVHSTTLAEILDRLDASLLVTTYQAGKLVIARPQGGVVNTHFRDFPAPMGLALAGGRLAVGTTAEVREFRDVPAVAAKLEPPGSHDACFLPYQSRTTGNILVHEMGYDADRTLWLVNTRFSCLCTLDDEHSFVPRWRPRFISALTPDDRCHLNGLGFRDGRPRYATALGRNDVAGGWRPEKARGGVLMDIPTREIIVAGLSMPHSPRWHDGRLWVCESGSGTIGIVDEARGRYEPVAELPGFTRGLDFAGPLAFVGLSQVRESAVFSGIPITDRLPEAERMCGVWVVDTTSGQTVALLRFEEGVQEIFAALLTPGRRHPDLLNDDAERINNAFVLPDEALAQIPDEFHPQRPSNHSSAPTRSPASV
jgi:uncharacterized protein (TIGR03032 family)